MVRNKALTLLLIAGFFAGSASAVSLHVSIDSVTEADARNIQYQENFTGVQELNASMMNTGSIGCQYRLKLLYNYSNSTRSAYSSSQPLWPGETGFAELKAPVTNYTGNVNASLSVEYCGQEQELENLSFNSTTNITTNTTLESRTLKSDKEGAEVRVNTKNGDLIPVETPAHWKASSTSIENGTATVEYEAPIFDERRNITYMVQSDGEIIGTTKVQLKARETIIQKILSVDQRKLYTVILLMAFLNLILIHRTLKNRN